MAEKDRQTKTGGRAATSGVIRGAVALSVGHPGTELPEGWSWTPLHEVARLETGHTPSRKQPAYWDGDIPWIGIRDATANHGRRITDTNQHVTQEGINNSSARILPADTVCLSRTASVGYVVEMGVPMATSQDFVNWVCGPRLDHRYLKYALLAEHEHLHRFASGTTHQTIYFPEVKGFHLAIPELEEQQLIADLLGALDDKIEVNQRLVTEADALAQALFEQERRAAPVRSLKNLANSGQMLFSDGYRTKRSELGEAGYPIMRVADVADGFVRPLNGDCVRPEFGPRLATKVAQLGDVVVTTKGTVGRAALVEDSHVGAAYSPQLCFIRVGEGGPSASAVLRWLRSDDFKRQAAALQGQTDMADYINLRDFGSLLMPVIRNDSEMASTLRDLDDLAAAHRAESRTLAEIRDALLPKLLTGELRVRKAEDVVGEVA